MEMQDLLFIHPGLQALATLLGAYNLWLGLARFRALHLGQNRKFRRNQHIWVGKVAVWLWFFGSLGGLFMARYAWGAWLITDWHAYVGLAALPWLVAMYISGQYMANRPARRKMLPALHGLMGLVMLGLAFYQFHSGRLVLADFVY